jgi:hypothetical protein
MTVKELIEKLKALPEDYQVMYETGDYFGSTYYAYVDEISVKHHTKEVKLSE